MRLPARPLSAWLAVLAAACGVVPTLAAAQSLAGEVSLSSALVDRGILVGADGPVAQVAAGVYGASGWGLGLAVAAQTGSRHLNRMVARASQAWVLSNEWQLQAGLLYYAYPGDAVLRDYNRVELGSALVYRDVLVLGVSGSSYAVARRNSNTLQWASDLSLRWPLGPQWSVSGGVGNAEIIPGRRYSYGNAGLAWFSEPYRLELNYFVSDRQARDLLGGKAAQRWIATLTRKF